MTEPVGNQPRKKQETVDTGIAAISGNSHKGREGNKEKVDREPVEKIVEGKVITRKVPWYTKFTRSIVAEDAGNVGEFILADVVIPATKNLILDMVSQSIERMLFGTSRGRFSGARRTPLGMSLREQVNYGGYSRDREPRRMMSREARARHDFQEVVLDTRTEAVEVIENLIKRIHRYGDVTVTDLYDFLGVSGSFADQRWGWTDLATAEVRQVPGGFLLDLPAPEPIRKD